jgi:phage shock protein A
MRQSEFDKISAALDRAEFAIQEIRRKVDELTSKRAETRTLKEIAAIDLEANELLHHLRKISDAVHNSNPAPHLRLISDAD